HNRAPVQCGHGFGFKNSVESPTHGQWWVAERAIHSALRFGATMQRLVRRAEASLAHPYEV
ncbi:hypothetical protein LAZ29_01480, partial [Cereibacter sphaeroides]|uniref:hypothetical protein n=1 Tax=Cereibacter sphaeroides TaxID=1063 RepID=UPI001F3C822B